MPTLDWPTKLLGIRAYQQAQGDRYVGQRAPQGGWGEIGILCVHRNEAMWAARPVVAACVESSWWLSSRHPSFRHWLGVEP